MAIKATICKGCKKEIVWAKIAATGSNMPLDAEARPAPKFGLVAFNHDTGGGKVLSLEDIVKNEAGRSPAEVWASKWPMTFHRTHFADNDCPIVKARKAGHRVNPETGEIRDAA